MGAGASVDGGAPAEGAADGRSRYFCHMCRRPFSSGHQAANTRCPHCGESFVEHVEEFRYAGGGGNAIRVIHRDAGSRGAERDRMDMSEDQRRRLFNAAALLQLLEAHLREELLALERAVRDSENGKAPGALTDLAKYTFLKNTKVGTDDICAQPSCPICNEDFALSEQVLQLQCSHIFHESCVLPWLEMKHNCPICRCDVSDRLPTLSEIQELTETEIRQRMRWHNHEPRLSKDRFELAKHLHEILVQHRDLYNEIQPLADNSTDAVEPLEAERTILLPGHTYTISSRGEISHASHMLQSRPLEDRDSASPSETI